MKRRTTEFLSSKKLSATTYRQFFAVNRVTKSDLNNYSKKLYRRAVQADEAKKTYDITNNDYKLGAETKEKHESAQKFYEILKRDHTNYNACMSAALGYKYEAKSDHETNETIYDASRYMALAFLTGIGVTGYFLSVSSMLQALENNNESEKNNESENKDEMRLVGSFQ